jgi:hypothetical protein
MKLAPHQLPVSGCSVDRPRPIEFAETANTTVVDRARGHLIQAILLASLLLPIDADAAPREFNIWAASCAHVPADIRKGRESLAKAIRQSEGLVKDAPAFNWDIMIDAGDLSAHQYPPGDPDGMELIRQYQVMTKHRREQIYNVPGNHDAPYYDHGPGSWIRKWGDPLGENTEFSGVDPKRRPFPVEGMWERYRFQAGNILFLMLADRNDVPEPVGRGHSKDHQRGGYPAGAVTRDTFNWWTEQVLTNQDKIIITMHHHVLRDTTIASGNGEGNPRYHGASGGAEGSSYLYYLIENEDPDNFKYTADAHVFEDFLDEFHKEHGKGAIDLWIGGHTHVHGPEDDWGDKTISERKWGVGFLQVAALTRHHGGTIPLSRLITFADKSDRFSANVYLHEPWFEDNPIGFYEPSKISWPLRHKFDAPSPIKPMSPFPESARVVTERYVTDSKGKKHHAPGMFKAGTSGDRSGTWDPETGRVQVKSGSTMKLNGAQRVQAGAVKMDDWTDLTVSAWINTTNTTSNMRIVSKDDIGTQGNFVLLETSPGTWAFRVWDDQANKFQATAHHADQLSDGQWHHLVGVVDSASGRVRLYVDGKSVASAPWTAKTLDDSDETRLVLGADSGKKRFGQTFTGQIRDIRVLSMAWSADTVRSEHRRPGD